MLFCSHLGNFSVNIAVKNLYEFFRNIIDANVFSNHQMAAFAAFVWD